MPHNIVIVGEAWGREEAEAREAFVGPPGKLLGAMLSQAGIAKYDCFLTCVLNLQAKGPPFPDGDLRNVCGAKADGVPGLPPLVKGKYLRAEFAPELDRLYREIRVEQPTLIIAMGATASAALLGTEGIKKVRGAPSLVSPEVAAKIGYRPKVLPTYHPAAVLREFKIRPIVISDLHKARRESEFPELRRPSREIWIEPTLADLVEFDRSFIQPSRDLSVDIETAGRQITCIGFAPSTDRCIVVPFTAVGRAGGNYWPTLADEIEAWKFVRKWCAEAKHYVFQNGLYDMNFLWTEYGITFENAKEIDDTMLIHHSLQPEMEKGLGFLGSIYTDELPWKFMRTKHETIKKED